MRQLVAVLALVLLPACSNPIAPSSTVAGTWAENFTVPGASLIVTLDGAGNGSGTYAIEAGRSGDVQVTGAVAPSMVTLTIRYDYGVVRTFRATHIDSNHLSGTFDDTTATVVFARP